MKYSSVQGILLTLIIISTTKLSSHPLIRNILGFLLIFMIVKGLKIRTHPMKILFLSLIITLILELIGTFMCKNNFENFDNMDDLVEKLEAIEKKVKENDKENTTEPRKVDKREKDGGNISISDIETIEVDDDNDHKYNDKGSLSNKKVDIKNYTPHTAQQETFKLLNTVRDLKMTVEELAPTLSTAKDILGVYKQIKV